MPFISFRIQDAYSKEYQIFKPDKRLRWLPMLGMVQIEFEMKDRIVETEITVLAAAFVELFLEKRQFSFSCFRPLTTTDLDLVTLIARWTITELMQRVNMKEQHKHIALRVVSRELMDNAKVLDEVDDEPETFEVMEFERSKKDRRAKAAPAGKYYMTSRFEAMKTHRRMHHSYGRIRRGQSGRSSADACVLERKFNRAFLWMVVP
jgi:hypothetical protein